MHRQNVFAVGLLLFVFVLVVSVGYAKGYGPLGLLDAGIRRLTSGGSTIPEDRLMDETNSANAPEFAAGTWINSEPLTIKGLSGRVVLVEFWTFGCYNCRNTLPYVKRWHDRYSEKGLTIVGVHSPEFEEERNADNVRKQVASLGIRFPVVTDNDYQTWRAYRVQAWPTIFLLDKTSNVRWTHVGEGAYDEAERTIQKLLAEEVKAESVVMSDNVVKN